VLPSFGARAETQAAYKPSLLLPLFASAISDLLQGRVGICCLLAGLLTGPPMGWVHDQVEAPTGWLMPPGA
jgi:hypothetical protein